MIKTNEIISAAESMPIEFRIELIAKLLDGINPSKKEIDELWAKEIETRVKEIESGMVKPIPGEEVFREIIEIENRIIGKIEYNYLF